MRSRSLRKRSITCTWKKVKRKIAHKTPAGACITGFPAGVNALAKPGWSQYNGCVYTREVTKWREEKSISLQQSTTKSHIYVEQVPLGTHTIPKLIFDIDKSAYYKAILAIFLRIDFCIFRCQNKENPS